MHFTRFVLCFKHCDFSSGTSNLRPTYGTIPTSLKSNPFFFKKFGRLHAKFLGH